MAASRTAPGRVGQDLNPSSSRRADFSILHTGSLSHITHQRPEVVDVYETVLYGACIDALATFHRDVIGLPLIVADPDPMAALRLPHGGVILIIDPANAKAPGREVPPHGATGPGHVAFRVDDLDAWREHLATHQIAIEREVNRGGALSSI